MSYAVIHPALSWIEVFHYILLNVQSRKVVDIKKFPDWFQFFGRKCLEEVDEFSSAVLVLKENMRELINVDVINANVIYGTH